MEIVIFGCGGHGRSVGDILLLNNPEAKLLFVDQAAKPSEMVLGFSVVKEIPQNKSYDAIVGIGNNLKRKEIFEKLVEDHRVNIISVISRETHKGCSSWIGQGCFIGNFCHIGPEVNIGANTIVNNGCVIDHEVQVGRHCHIGPNSAVSGRSVIGDLVFLGAGSTVIDKVAICSNVVIGAGATVTKDIREPGTYVGTPAVKLFKTRV